MPKVSKDSATGGGEFGPAWHDAALKTKRATLQPLIDAFAKASAR